jgi:RimJ/RimL family protein N-acetyltransferase
MPDFISISDSIKIRRLVSEDAASLFSVVEKNREHLNVLDWVTSATEETTRNFLKIFEPPSMNCVFGIYVNNELSGTVELGFQEWYMVIGYWLDNDCRRKGIMSEVVKFLTDRYISQYPLSAKIRIQNIGSYKVLRRAGLAEVNRIGDWIYMMRLKEVAQNNITS